jgi:hypothetical protein
MQLNEFQQELCTQSRWDFSDLEALFVNCTLKKSPDVSHTQGLMDIAIAIMEANEVTTETSGRSITRSHPASTTI